MLRLIPTMRLDVFLFEKGYAHSRTFAKSLISSGKVLVDGKVVTKASFDFGDSSKLEIAQDVVYVSRGAYKLEGAANTFSVNISGKFCIDIGASSGGFTDYLLKNGAAHVIAIDSGTNQLADVLRQDIRVTSIENYNARYMKKADFEYEPDLAVMDVSFISATYIIKPLFDILKPGADFICLIKPQFEVGKALVGKGGIVKDEYARKLAINKVVSFAEETGFYTKGVIKSPIEGGDGNTEYLAHFVKSRILGGQNEENRHNSKSK